MKPIKIRPGIVGGEISLEDYIRPGFGDDSGGLETIKSAAIWRVTLFIAFVMTLFFILFVRLFSLQVISGEQNKLLADGNRIQIRTIHAPRGVIFDRNGRVLASNTPGFRYVDPGTKKSTFLTREEVFNMEIKNDSRVAFIETDSIRSYPAKEELAHVLGYTGEISADQLKDPVYSKYKQGDWIGQSGIEKQYQSVLRGVDGGEVIEIDAQGSKKRTLRRIQPIPGNNIYLTIDKDLQHQTYVSLQGALANTGSCCGTAIAQNPQTGEVLAMVSLPSYDNNVFTEHEKGDQIEKIFTSTQAPVLNRAIEGTYPPGSTFKIISSIAALESGKFTKDTVIEDTGQIFLGPFKFTNWYFTLYGGTDGQVNLVKALRRSNDIYFYRVGEAVGVDEIGKWAKQLKLGQTLGIDLPGEAEGLIPNNDWKERTYGESWYPGDDLHMAIGQGFILVTPIQVLGFMSYMAVDGKMYKPHLLLKVVKGTDQVITTITPEVIAADVVQADYLRTIKQGLEEVTQAGGSAWPFFTYPIKTAGKTGTAEIGDPNGKTHAWYTSYAPADDPKIATVVIIEKGGQGSSISAPVTKEMYNYFFNIQKPSTNHASPSAGVGD